MCFFLSLYYSFGGISLSFGCFLFMWCLLGPCPGFAVLFFLQCVLVTSYRHHTVKKYCHLCNDKPIFIMSLGHVSGTFKNDSAIIMHCDSLLIDTNFSVHNSLHTCC